MSKGFQESKLKLALKCIQIKDNSILIGHYSVDHFNSIIRTHNNRVITRCSKLIHTSLIRKRIIIMFN